MSYSNLPGSRVYAPDAVAIGVLAEVVMGLIFLGIFVLAMVITGIGEYRRFLRASKSGTRTAFAKKDKK